MFSKEETQIIEQAAAIFESKIKTTDAFTSPNLVKGFCQNRLAHQHREIFMVLLLDNQNRLIEAVELFAGTIDAASVYPREVAKLALEKNSAALILAHNHPSGVVEPSQADRRITRRLSDALNLIDVRVLDHLVVGNEGVCSFAERGWM